MALVCRNARNLSTLGDISDHQGTSDFTLKHIGRFEDAKLRKEALEATLSGCFGRGRRILAPQSKSDTATCENAVQCAFVGRSAAVGWSQTFLNTPLKGYASSLCRVLLV